MQAPAWLPTLNTSLIVVSGLFLAIGYTCIRRKQVRRHRASMLTATVFAALFLVVYIARAMLFETKLFAGEGLVRVVYLIILISHTVLATLVGPLVLIVLYRAFKRQFARHRQLARITVPIWAYVVVTGWAIYLLLY
ncbi:MAG: DUF420 domain-containing protein [Chloroflexi bacterium]|nr:DUF420 domain-containing protein [Chloroflexota bacterium]